MSKLDLLKAKGVSRRDFMKLMAAATAALGLPELMIPKAVNAVEGALEKPPVIWLHGMECTGCSESLLATINPTAAQVVLDMLSIRYHETIMAASGHVAEQAYHDTLHEDFILVVEGSIPKSKEWDLYCMVGERPFRETMIEAGKAAQAVIAIGSCACEGAGIPGACECGAVGVSEFFRNEGIKTPVINLPCCPVKPNTLIGTIVYYLTFNSVPELDNQGRPKVFYGNLLHDNCPRRGQFENGNYLLDWNNPAQSEYCLILKGCKGPVTHTDCVLFWWNDNINTCLKSGAPCSGCAEKTFYNGFSPLYTKHLMFSLPGIGRINPTVVGGVAAVATVAGIGVHLAASAAAGRIPKKDNHDK